jgi:hypothetical protein
MKKALLLLFVSATAGAQAVSQTEFYNLVNRVNQLQQALTPANQNQLQAQQQSLQTLIQQYNAGNFPQASSTPPLSFIATPGTSLQAICNAIPATFGPTDIYIPAGNYPYGCYLANKTPAAGGYINFHGSYALADAGAGLLASGSIASATGLLTGGNGWPTITVSPPAGGYADGGLRGHLLELFNDGGTVGGLPTQISAIYDNTSTVITMGGHLPNLPSTSWTFAIVDAASIFDGGVTLPFSTPSAQIAQRAPSASWETGPVPNYAAFVFSNIGAATAVPYDISAANGSTNAGGNVYLSGIMATGFPGKLMAAYSTPGITLFGSQMVGLTSTDACLNRADDETYLVSDYALGAPGDQAFLCGPEQSRGALLEEGVVGDAVMAVGTILQNGILGGGVEDKNPWLSVHLSLSSYRGLTSSGDAVITSSQGRIRLDGLKIEGVAGAACVMFGTEDDALTEGAGGSMSVLVRGGYWNGCQSGMFAAGGYYNFQQGTPNGVTGTNTNYGLYLVHGAHVDINVSSSMLATGGAGDIFLGGSTVSYASMGSLGIAIGLDGLSRVNEGAPTTGAVVYMNNGFKVPQDQHGSDAGTSGNLSVSFSPVFTAVPDCTCNVQGALLACEIVSRSTTGAQFTDTTGGSDVIVWDCKN